MERIWMVKRREPTIVRISPRWGMGGFWTRDWAVWALRLDWLRTSMPMRAMTTAMMVGAPTRRRRRMAWARGAKTTERAVRKLEVEGSV
jgi:hypothetical protein